jgi:Phosphodiester glycosidase
MRRLWTAASLAGLCAMAACSSPSAAPHAGGPSSRTGPPATSTGHSPAASSGLARPGASPAAEVLPAAPRVTVTRMRTTDGSVVTVATFAGPVTYVLHDGSEDPGAAAGRVKAGPAVAGAERKRLLAAFNGGFKLSAGVGGYEQEGHVVSALRRGLTSLVIDRSGQARIGVWGRGVPAPGEAVYSVRQNLPPLVLNGRPTAAAADTSLWGATLGGGEYVARSALGQDASGDLIYAASMGTTAADLAFVLAYAGARIAMELDINPEWVQLDVARRPGGSLRASILGQDRPADQYLTGWARDFIAVLGPPPAPRPGQPPRQPPRP